MSSRIRHTGRDAPPCECACAYGAPSWTAFVCRMWRTGADEGRLCESRMGSRLSIEQAALELDLLHFDYLEIVRRLETETRCIHIESNKVF